MRCFYFFLGPYSLLRSSHSALVTRHALQLGNIDAIQNHRQFTGAQLHRSPALLDSRYFENSNFQALVPQYKAVAVPHQDLQTISASRTEHEQMTTLRILPDDHLYTFRQPIESAAHVRRFTGHPDSRSLRAIHRL